MTYNVHEGEEVRLDAGLAMVTHHHLVSDHQRFHVALRADAAHPLPAVVGQVLGVLQLLFHILRKGEIADRLPPFLLRGRYCVYKQKKREND